MGRLALCTLTLMLSTMLSMSLPAQVARLQQDPKLNNLVHGEGYVTCRPDALGRVDEVGTGPQEMILIAGAGFGGDIYQTFMESRKSTFRMYAVTLPGFGGTSAPPMPPEGTSYGDQTWTRGAQRGVWRLIEDEDMTRPIIVAHWLNAPVIALRLALEHPDRIRAVVIIAGVAKVVSKTLPESLNERILLVDQGFAPQWFKTVTRDTWDDNNFLPGDYAQHPLRALQLWRQAAEPPLPVRIRYTCEQWAQDITPELAQLQVPTLILKPGFDEELYVPPGRPYLQSYCHDGWRGVAESNTKIRVQTIEDTRVFIMEDQPEKLDRAIQGFFSSLEKAPRER